MVTPPSGDPDRHAPPLPLPPAGRGGRVFVGLHGRVVCLDRRDGSVLWATSLPNASWNFVTVVSDVDAVFASSAGEVYALEPDTGTVRWHNPLKGYGVGLATIALERGDAYDLATSALAAAAAAAQTKSNGAG